MTKRSGIRNERLSLSTEALSSLPPLMPSECLMRHGATSGEIASELARMAAEHQRVANRRHQRSVSRLDGTGAALIVDVLVVALGIAMAVVLGVGFVFALLEFIGGWWGDARRRD